MLLAGGSLIVEQGEPTEAVHFPDGGLISAMAGRGRGDVEVGMIGREGMTGAWLVHGRRAAPFGLVAQATGRAWRMPADAFREACDAQAELRHAVFAFCESFTDMMTKTCWANTRLTIERRLARWLLLARERLGSDELTVTHDALARMLGVRRPGITVALHTLEGGRSVKATRGIIRIRDPDLLVTLAGGHSNGTPRSAASADT